MSTTSLSLQWRGGNSDGLQAATFPIPSRSLAHCSEPRRRKPQMCRAARPPRGSRVSANAPRRWVADARGPSWGQVTQQGGSWEELGTELPGTCQSCHVRGKWCALASWAWEARAQVEPCGQTLPFRHSPRTSFFLPAPAGWVGQAVWVCFHQSQQPGDRGGFWLLKPGPFASFLLVVVQIQTIIVPASGGSSPQDTWRWEATSSRDRAAGLRSTPIAGFFIQPCPPSLEPHKETSHWQSNGLHLCH